MNQAQRFSVGLFSVLLGLFSLFSILTYPWAMGKPELTWRVVLEAIWFTAQTITTTGYGSIPWPWPAKIQAISIGLMVVAVPLWTFLLGLLVNIVDQKLKKRNSRPTNHS